MINKKWVKNYKRISWSCETKIAFDFRCVETSALAHTHTHTNIQQRWPQGATWKLRRNKIIRASIRRLKLLSVCSCWFFVFFPVRRETEKKKKKWHAISFSLRSQIVFSNNLFTTDLNYSSSAFSSISLLFVRVRHRNQSSEFSSFVFPIKWQRSESRLSILKKVEPDATHLR